jgi:hypothetical protein
VAQKRRRHSDGAVTDPRIVVVVVVVVSDPAGLESTVYALPITRWRVQQTEGIKSEAKLRLRKLGKGLYISIRGWLQVQST